MKWKIALKYTEVHRSLKLGVNVNCSFSVAFRIQHILVLQDNPSSGTTSLISSKYKDNSNSDEKCVDCICNKIADVISNQTIFWAGSFKTTANNKIQTVITQNFYSVALHAERLQRLIPFSFFWPQGAPLQSSHLEDRDRRSHAACHVRGCDRSSQHQAQHLGRPQSYG